MSPRIIYCSAKSALCSEIEPRKTDMAPSKVKNYEKYSRIRAHNRLKNMNNNYMFQSGTALRPTYSEMVNADPWYQAKPDNRL